MHQKLFRCPKGSRGQLLMAVLASAAVIVSSSALAQSTVSTKPTPVERNKIEKTITPVANKTRFLFARSAVAEPMARYIVSLVDDSVARYRGGVTGYDATSTEGQSKLDIKTPSAQAYIGYLATTQEKFLQAVTREIGRQVVPISQLQVASNTLVLELTKAEAQKIAQIPGLRQITEDKLLQLEKTESLSAFAQPSSAAITSTLFWQILAASLVMLAGLVFWAHRRGWVGRNNAVLVSAFAVLGLAGCYYEGGSFWIGAPEIWAGSDDLAPTRGEGIVVGVIDTGINPISDSFAEIDNEGYQHVNPKGRYFGVCDVRSKVYDSTFPCNNKLIGAWGAPTIDDGSPRDTDGHGSHTAGTSAGNLVVNATVSAPTGTTITKTIAGVAPRANVIAYKVCAEDGCYLSAILFAINQAILDGVDVINYSIGGGSTDPWADQDTLSFLSAMDAGIFVATSAGNSGPDFATLGSPADAPWITSVAASSHNFFYKHSVVDMINDQGQRLPEIIGQSIAPGYGPALIVDAADYGNPQCLAGAFNSRFEGQIVLCDAGTIARVAKGENVLANGGGGLILTRQPTTDDGSGYLETDAHVLPATHIVYADAVKLRTWLSQGSGHMARLSGMTPVVDDSYADVLAYFSSRGVNPSVPSIVKPNITAPGRAIFAAYYEDYSEAEQDYNIIQGTSMSSPHIAGAGALIKALHPQWTPMQIQSAMMTTAKQQQLKEDGITEADPFDVGAGRIDLPAAARAALVLDENLAGFMAADPFLGGKPSELNLTGLGSDACVVKCVWTRTVTNVSNQETRWRSRGTNNVRVTPRWFKLAPGESIELTFKADASRLDVNDWLFEQVPLESRTKGVPDVHFPLAALSVLSNLPKAIDISAASETDSVTLSDLQAVKITDAAVTVSGLAQSTVFSEAVVSDPTNSDPFDGRFDPSTDGSALFYFDVPEGASRLVAEISESQSNDLDLFVGYGDQPGVNLTSYATTGSALEYLNIEQPTAGRIWIVVQNWEAGHRESQAFTLHVAAVTDDAANLSVDVPLSWPAAEPFDVMFNFVLPGSKVGDRFYGVFELGSDEQNPTNLGRINIDLVRE